MSSGYDGTLRMSAGVVAHSGETMSSIPQSSVVTCNAPGFGEMTYLKW